MRDEPSTPGPGGRKPGTGGPSGQQRVAAWMALDSGPSSGLTAEFGHHYESDHLSEKYYRALCDLGARLTRLALVHPSFFRAHAAGV